MLNPKLMPGDKIMLLHMDGEMMSPGTKGIVTRVIKDPFESGDEQLISVEWEDGRSLSLISGVDAWKKIDDKPKLEESEQDKFFMSNIELVKFFNTKFLTDYLIKVRDSGITNMLGAAPYLYMGKDRLKHEFTYKIIPNENEFQEVLDMADKAQSEMINGTISLLEKQNKELTTQSINYALQKNATKIVQWYVNVLS